ncbi:hypothetical protein BJP36_10265 [Moorena producens JHB]|uniref:Uncharacterized protein n=1 Tax=Moorena producens (strain JHB) TaxID=1454205 RepID=A0A1D9GAV9_MOOP1|nr:hypothetical protein [Moorena producens]AOY84605.1 hypothetical protein BJP36_10265 [Moorena producens JHB]
MCYSQRLYGWVMIRLLPPMPPLVFARFDNLSDAKSYSQAMKQLMPHAKFLIFFDVSLPIDQDESES